ncbi:MAG: hypothetical protein Q8R83_06065 [Legionellaceae bacterium]|nr:hypothetical protein [Legionellaceae bacterium]
MRGGRSLNVEGFAPKVINAGHPIIKDTVSKDFKPLPVKGGGGIQALGVVVPGSGYTNNGTYTSVPLTGGSGTGAIATIVVAANAVSSVVITTPGAGYKSGDILSAAAANIGTSGSGFAVAASTVDSEASAYDSLPANHEYAGALIASIPTDTAFAAILTQGTINPAACPYDFATIAAAFKTAKPLIDQLED